MGRYFDYSDWKIGEITDSIRERLDEAKKPLPKKVLKKFIVIKYKTGDGCYSITGYDDWTWIHDEFKDREDAVKYINSKNWLERIGDNAWVDTCKNNTYKDKEGNIIPCHYEINEYENLVYEDGEYHTEYSQEEIDSLSEALLAIERARVYMRCYDSAENNADFGKGSFTERVNEEMEKFNNEYTESLPENYFYDNE